MLNVIDWLWKLFLLFLVAKSHVSEQPQGCALGNPALSSVDRREKRGEKQGDALGGYSPSAGICYSVEVTFLNISQRSDAVFKLDSKIGRDPQRIMWILTSKHLILANSSAGESSPDWIINSKQYEGRLSLLPDKSLRLSNLKTEDSGCYEADIKSFLGVITIQKFNLTVLETESTRPNLNLRIMVFIFISVLGIVGLIIACFYYQKQRGTHRKRVPHNEENGPEEN